MLRSARAGLRWPAKASSNADVVLVAVAGDACLGRVPADVDQQQIEPAVAVVVEEHAPRRVADVVQAGGGGDVAEAALAVVLEQHVAAAHGRDVEIGVAVVVDVGEDADTLTLPGTPTPADAVMSSNLPPPAFRQS